MSATAADRREVVVPVHAVRRTLLSIVAVLTVASAVAQVLHYALDTPYGYGLVPLFDSDAEANLPTWYSALTLLACSLLAAAAARAGNGWARHWDGLAVLFFVAALDESVRLHERANAVVSMDQAAGGVLSALWVIPGVLFSLAVAVAYRPFVAALPQSVRRLAIPGALMFVVGALALEVVEGAASDVVGEADSLADGLVSVAQEALEMLGVVWLILALITYVALTEASVKIDFSDQ